MPNLRLALVISFASSNGALIVNLFVSIVLARLLTPAEIGIYSIAAVLVAIAHIFRDFGVSSYLKREKTLTQEKIRAAMGVLITTSWTIAFTIFFASSYVARFYQQPEIQDVIQILALGFIFIPFGAIPMALLDREYRAKEAALASIFGVIAYATSAISLAYLGFSYMTQPWANLINILVTVISFNLVIPKNTPLIPSFKGWSKIVNFGAGAILTNSIKAINSALPDVILGKLSNPHNVGIMSRATSTANMFVQIASPTVNYATLPFFAQKYHAGEALDEPLSKAVAYLTVCAWPALIATGIFADALISFLYGPQWAECVPITKIICLLAILTVPFTFEVHALMAIGRPYLAALPGCIQFGTTIIAVYFLFDGTLQSFALSLVAASIFTYPVQIWLQSFYLKFRPIKFFKAQTRSAAISAAYLVFALVLEKLLNNNPAWLQLIIFGLLSMPILIILIKVFHHPIEIELLKFADRNPILKRLFCSRSISN